jgi:signal transduction histidine kinase
MSLAPGLVLAIAAGVTLLITASHRALNHLLTERPYLLGVDMLFAAGLLAVSRSTHSPYYLYALSPLLASAFFFQVRGALVAAGTFTPLYLLALAASQRLSAIPAEPEVLFTQLAGIWLIAVLFSYPSVLLKRLREAHDALMEARDDLAQQNTHLTDAHRQLKIIHDLTVSLQAASDVQSVQQRVLLAVTGELEFSQAIVGLVSPITQKLEGWQCYPPNGGPPPSVAPLPLEPESGLLVQWLMDRKAVWWSDEHVLTSDATLNAWLSKGPWLMLPMALREHPVGVLLVSADADPDGLPEDRLAMLKSVVSQAAVALGTTMLCIDRARRLAVEQERNRIARDIHDTVAQSLFGIVFTLDACIKMLPDQAEAVRQELVELRDLASQVRDEVRRSIFDIWPSELTLELFTDNLRKYAIRSSGSRGFHVDFSTGGDFSRLSPVIRRSLYRITQEALANVAHHAGVNSARVCMRVEADRVYLSIQDRGRGFDPEAVLTREQGRERFGLLGMRERIHALGGECEIVSRSGEGTSVSIQVPVNGRYGYA